VAASPPCPFHQGRPARLRPFLFLICAWLFLKKTNDVSPAEANDTSLVLPRFRPLWWPENQGPSSFEIRTFSTCFSPQNTLETMTNLSMILKNRPKNRTQPEIKNQLELIYVFS